MSKISNLERSISDLEQKVSKQKHALEVMKSKLASLRNQESSQTPSVEEVNAASNGAGGFDASSSGGSGLHTSHMTEYFLAKTEEGKSNGLGQPKLDAISFGDLVAKSTGDAQHHEQSAPSTEVINRLVNGASRELAKLGKGFMVQYSADEGTGYKFLFRYNEGNAPVAMVRLEPGGWLYQKEQIRRKYMDLNDANKRVAALAHCESVSWDRLYSTAACVIVAFMLSTNELYPVDSGSRKDGRGGGLRTTLNNQIKEEFT